MNEPSAEPLPNNIDRDFEIAVRRLAEDLRFGYDASPYLGSGVDYAQSRPFVYGDSVKNIDWKLTARHNRYHVKEYESVKCTPVYIIIDTSASMAVQSQRWSKYTLAVLIAGGIGMAAMRRLSPVGVLGAEQTRLGERLLHLQPHLKSRSMVCVISDLHDPTAISSIKSLSVAHDCVVLQIVDPAERGRLGGGILRTVEAESGNEFVTHGRSRWFSPEAQSKASTEFKRVGVDHLVLATDQPFVAPLRRFLADRAGLMRGTR
jgi:hypothetical protein